MIGDFTFEDDKETRIYGSPPAKKDLHILTFNDAKGCVKDIQTELRYGRNTTQALRHFGSISLSNGKLIPIPGTHLGTASLSSNGFSINSKMCGPSFEEYSVQSSYVGSIGYQHYNWFVGGNATGSEQATQAYVPTGTITGSGNFSGTPQLKKIPSF